MAQVDSVADAGAALEAKVDDGGVGVGDGDAGSEDAFAVGAAVPPAAGEEKEILDEEGAPAEQGVEEEKGEDQGGKDDDATESRGGGGGGGGGGNSAASSASATPASGNGNEREKANGDEKDKEGSDGDDSNEDEPELEWKVPDQFLADGDDSDLSIGYDHLRLMCSIYKFARPAKSATDHEGWIREIPFTVVAYESIVSGVIDLDYAPCSLLVSHEGRSRRLWVNVSQEAKSAIDDLREMKLINGLKLSTEDFQPVTAFQISHRGCHLIENDLPEGIMESVAKFLYPEGAPATEE